MTFTLNLHLLTMLFAGLKLTDVIAWSWWIVLSPTIIGMVFTIAIWSLVIGMVTSSITTTKSNSKRFF